MQRYGIILVVTALLVHGGDVRAASLDSESCAKLKSELTSLEQVGTRGSLLKGPEWAKTNLAPDKLEQVRRLIELDEVMIFRCSGKPLVLLPTESEPDLSGAAEKEGGKDQPDAAKAKAAEKKPATAKKAAAVPASKSAPAKANTAGQPGASAASDKPEPAKQASKAVKAKPKEKANDAFQPPPPGSATPPPGNSSPGK
jgi:hypothetical protein